MDGTYPIRMRHHEDVWNVSDLDYVEVRIMLEQYARGTDPVSICSWNQSISICSWDRSDEHMLMGLVT